jgi:hypothetical protein
MLDSAGHVDPSTTTGNTSSAKSARQDLTNSIEKDIQAARTEFAQLMKSLDAELRKDLAKLPAMAAQLKADHKQRKSKLHLDEQVASRALGQPRSVPLPSSTLGRLAQTLMVDAAGGRSSAAISAATLARGLARNDSTTSVAEVEAEYAKLKASADKEAIDEAAAVLGEAFAEAHEENDQKLRRGTQHLSKYESSIRKEAGKKKETVQKFLDRRIVSLTAYRDGLLQMSDEQFPQVLAAANADEARVFSSFGVIDFKDLDAQIDDRKQAIRKVDSGSDLVLDLTANARGVEGVLFGLQATPARLAKQACIATANTTTSSSKPPTIVSVLVCLPDVLGVLAELDEYRNSALSALATWLATRPKDKGLANNQRVVVYNKVMSIKDLIIGQFAAPLEARARYQEASNDASGLVSFNRSISWPASGGTPQSKALAHWAEIERNMPEFASFGTTWTGLRTSAFAGVEARTPDHLAVLRSHWILGALDVYDREQLDYGVAFAAHLGTAINGMGSSAAGRLQVDSWLGGPIIGDANLLLRAFSRNIPSVQAAIEDRLAATKQSPNFSKAFSQMAELGSAAVKSLELADNAMAYGYKHGGLGGIAAWEDLLGQRLFGAGLSRPSPFEARLAGLLSYGIQSHIKATHRERARKAGGGTHVLGGAELGDADFVCAYAKSAMEGGRGAFGVGGENGDFFRVRRVGIAVMLDAVRALDGANDNNWVIVGGRVTAMLSGAFGIQAEIAESAAWGSGVGLGSFERPPDTMESSLKYRGAASTLAFTAGLTDAIANDEVLDWLSVVPEAVGALSDVFAWLKESGIIQSIVDVEKAAKLFEGVARNYWFVAGSRVLGWVGLGLLASDIGSAFLAWYNRVEILDWSKRSTFSSGGYASLEEELLALSRTVEVHK